MFRDAGGNADPEPEPEPEEGAFFLDLNRKDMASCCWWARLWSKDGSCGGGPEFYRAMRRDSSRRSLITALV